MEVHFVAQAEQKLACCAQCPLVFLGERALQLQACSYTSLRSILKRSLDRQLTLEPEDHKPGPRHKNVRGASYYDAPTTLLQ